MMRSRCTSGPENLGNKAFPDPDKAEGPAAKQPELTVETFDFIHGDFGLMLECVRAAHPDVARTTPPVPATPGWDARTLSNTNPQSP